MNKAIVIVFFDWITQVPQEDQSDEQQHHEALGLADPGGRGLHAWTRAPRHTQVRPPTLTLVPAHRPQHARTQPWSPIP